MIDHRHTGHPLRPTGVDAGQIERGRENRDQSTWLHKRIVELSLTNETLWDEDERLQVAMDAAWS
jgi:hypothetical protein